MFDLEKDKFATDYLLLGLRTGKHINGYVEHCYGPTNLKQLVEKESLLSPKRLLKDCNNLIENLDKKNYDNNRLCFLNKTLISLQTILRRLNGETIPYINLIRKIYDFEPILYNESKFFELKDKAEEFYKGDGTLYERMNNYSKRRALPKAKLKETFQQAINLARERTYRNFPNIFPFNEKVEINEVENQSWDMYNWYQGNYKSRIDIDLNKTLYWTDILPLACHEAYPGHHTEASIQDYLLVRKKGFFEYSILLIYSPQILIHEGLGVLAEDLLFDINEATRLSFENFCTNPEVEDSLEILIAQKKIKRGFSNFESNLAYLKHICKWTNDDLIKYIKKFEMITEDRIKSMINFISDEIWGLYIFAYQGEWIIKRYLAKNSPRCFLKLISEQVLPSDL